MNLTPKKWTMMDSSLSASWLSEPLLEFGEDGLHVDPKEGIARYGPHTWRTPMHPNRIRVGIISTAELTETTRSWLRSCAQGIDGDDKNPRFPGFMSDRGFMAELDFADQWDALLSARDIREIMDVRYQRDRFPQTVELLDSKLRLISQRDLPPDYVIVAMPDEFYKRCRVADYPDKELNVHVHRDLRRSFKAKAMQYRVPTQLVREVTVTRGDGTPPSRVAWNFFTALYTKAGGRPWAPTDLPNGSCYVGISFHRPFGEASKVQSSVVQAFDDHGEGLIMRGPDFEWDEARHGTRSPHLSEAHALEIMSTVLAKYSEVLEHTPTRVVVHKSSKYWPEELAGFQIAVDKVASRSDFVALAQQSRFRAVPPSRYPPLRGTRLQIGRLDYLYTTGFISALGEFHGMHVPSPLEVADHVGGDTSRVSLLSEIMTLTKLNWNSAFLGGALPITLRFSRLVGEILRELPDGQDPLPQFKYYI